MLRGHRSASPLYCGGSAAVSHCLTTGASARVAGHSSYGLRRLVHTNPTPVGGAAPQPPPTGGQPAASTGAQLQKIGTTGAKVWRFFRGAILLVAVGSGFYLYQAYKLAESIPENVVLKLNFEKPYPETQTSQFLPVLTLQDVVDGLDAAAKDPRVKAVIATLGSETLDLPIAQVQELRDALKKFRETDKPAVCHVEVFNGNNDYYLATAFDHIVMQSSGWLALTGIAVSPVFLRGLFDKLDIEPQMLQRHEYKNFANTFNEKGFTPAHREATESMASSLHKQLVNDIAEARKIAPSRLQTLIDQGPLLPREALEEGLVDRIDYRDGAYALLKARVADAQKEHSEQAKAVVATPAQKADKKVRFMSFKKYVKKTKEEKELAKLKRKSADAKLLASDAAAFQTLKEIHDNQVGSSPNAEDARMKRKLIRRAERGKSGLPKVAVIYAAGEIVTGYHEQQRVVASKNISEALRAAVRDKDVKAIVLRVNSPGGSAVASNSIWWETVKAKEAGLPIVVSMGDYAASGGYFISAAADRIIAQPATLTGSIGVIFGKFVLDKFLANKLGVTVETVEKGEHANFLSPTRNWTPSELALCNKFMDESYHDFVSKVASGRGFTFEQAYKIAKGRVWTGAEAKELGLVDELGGLSRAVEVAKDLAGPLPPGVEYDVVIMPRPKSLRDVIFKGSAYSDAHEDEDEQPESGGGFGSLMEQMSHEWGTAARLVRFVSSLPMVKAILRETQSPSGVQYRMDDVSVSSKESDLV